MKPKHFSFLLVFCFTTFGAVASHADTPPDEVWVAVRFADLGESQGLEEYYGLAERKALTTLQEAPVPGSFLKLDDTVVMTDGAFAPLSLAGSDTAKYGYGSVMYIRVDTIYRIIELDDAFVKDHLEAKPVKDDSASK